jgi:hypothetical protein
MLLRAWRNDMRHIAPASDAIGSRSNARRGREANRDRLSRLVIRLLGLSLQPQGLFPSTHEKSMLRI